MKNIKKTVFAAIIIICGYFSSCFYQIPPFLKSPLKSQTSESPCAIIPDFVSMTNVQLVDNGSGTSWCSIVYYNNTDYKLVLYKISIINGVPQTQSKEFPLIGAPSHPLLLEDDLGNAYFIYSNGGGTVRMVCYGFSYAAGYSWYYTLDNFLTAALAPNRCIVFFCELNGNLEVYKYSLINGNNPSGFVHNEIPVNNAMATKAHFFEDGSYLFAYSDTTDNTIKYSLTTLDGNTSYYDTYIGGALDDVDFLIVDNNAFLVFRSGTQILCQTPGNSPTYLFFNESSAPLCTFKPNIDTIGILSYSQSFVATYYQYPKKPLNNIPLYTQTLSLPYSPSTLDNPVFCGISNNGSFIGVLHARFETANRGMRFSFYPVYKK